MAMMWDLGKRPLSYAASLNSLAGRKATFLLALILIGSPVAASPFLRCLVVNVSKSPSIASPVCVFRACH